MSERALGRILVVDDASLARLYYREALTRAGYVVEEALNGLEALEKLLIQPVDLLIVDINMPKMDGLSFLKVLRRQMDPVASIPALVISSESGPHDHDAARAAGANFYAAKPVTQEALVQFAAMLCGAPA
jgi:two-component system chemotaxis response regulator CheY